MESVTILLGSILAVLVLLLIYIVIVGPSQPVNYHYVNCCFHGLRGEDNDDGSVDPSLDDPRGGVGRARTYPDFGDDEHCDFEDENST